MAWIETIRIILGRGNRGVEHLEVLKSLERELASARSLQWEIYRNMSAQEDVLIVLRWERGPPTHLESDIALALARELKKHGLVDHNVWMNRVNDNVYDLSRKI